MIWARFLVMLSIVACSLVDAAAAARDGDLDMIMLLVGVVAFWVAVACALADRWRFERGKRS